MKTNVFHGKDDTDIEYIFHKSDNESSRTLVVAFPAPRAGMRGGDWGYLVTLRKIADVNVLFIRTNSEYSKSRLTYHHGKPVIENAILGLVEQCKKEIDEDVNIITIGASMGGYCALYYGLKYGWHIIACSPACNYDRSPISTLDYASTGHTDKDREWLNSLLPSIIAQAGESNYSKKYQCHILYGEGEWRFKVKTQVPKMLEQMKSAGLIYNLMLIPFSDHQIVCELFPQFLTPLMNIVMGYDSNLSAVLNKFLQDPKTVMYDKINSAYKPVSDYLKSASGFVGECKINNAPFEKNNDPMIALRAWAYANVGWYFGEKSAEPQEFGETENLWSLKTAEGDREILSFYFHGTLLNYAVKYHKPEVMAWLKESISDYFTIKPNITNQRWWDISHFDHLARLMFFMEFHKQIQADNVPSEYLKKIGDEIKHSFGFLIAKLNSPQGIIWRFRIQRAALQVSLYFKRYADFSNLLYHAALDTLHALLEYHFDKNGFCISAKSNVSDIVTRELRDIINFINANDFESCRELRLLEKQYNRIRECTAHLSRPDNVLIGLGNSPYELRRTRRWLKRSLGNFIRPESNIVILEDKDSLSYITVGGGSNRHSANKHQDLLSFTWYYNGKQIFYDAGPGANNLEEYASSAIAHNAFICEEQSYITPDYDDWTSISDVAESDESVSISMSHELIDGVKMKRKLVWVKPNIIILMDEALSEIEHEFAQNFLLGDFQADTSSANRIRLTIDKDFHMSIVQCIPQVKLATFHGKNTSDGNLRGTLIAEGSRVSRGLNLVFSERGNKAKFFTIIQCESPLSKSGKEKKITKLYNDPQKGLVVEFSDASNKIRANRQA